MIRQSARQQLVEVLEAEYAEVGIVVTPDKRERLQSVLDRFDRVVTRADAVALCAELQHELQHLRDQDTPTAHGPETWLGEAECA